MNQLYQFPGFSRHKTLNKIHIIQILPCGNTEGGIVIPVVHNVLRPQPVAVLLFKLLQRFHGDCGAIAKPVHEFFLGLVIKHQGKMVEKGGEANHISGDYPSAIG